MPKVTVLTICYNHARFLPARIDSILNQTFQDFDWIIVDDASTDGSQAILAGLRNHPKVKKLIFHTKNIGCYPSYDEALGFAEGEYVARAEGDDVCQCQLLAAETAVLDNYANVGLVYTSCPVIDGEGKLLFYFGEPQSEIWNNQVPIQIQAGIEAWKREVVENFIASPTVMFRRHCYETLGKFLHNLTRNADWEYWLRLALRFDLAYIPVPLGSWRHHGSNLTDDNSYRQTPDAMTERYRVQREAFACLPSDFAHLAKLRQVALRRTSQGVAEQCKVALNEGKRDLVLRTLILMFRYDPGAIMDGKVARLIAGILPGGNRWGAPLLAAARRARGHRI